jgi:hypothetical protein
MLRGKRGFWKNESPEPVIGGSMDGNPHSDFLERRF